MKKKNLFVQLSLAGISEPAVQKPQAPSPSLGAAQAPAQQSGLFCPTSPNNRSLIPPIHLPACFPARPAQPSFIIQS